MSEHGGLPQLEELRMRKKRGTTPRRVWNRLVDALKTLRVTSADDRLRVESTWGVGTRLGLDLPPAGGLGADCLLGRPRPDPEGSGDVYFEAGYINAAGLHELVGGPLTLFTPVIGEAVWAEVTLTAGLTETVLDGSYSASLPALGSGALPEDHEWTHLATAGKAYAPLGEWVDDGEGNPKWQREGCGSITFALCIATTQSATARYYRTS